ncbi:MULTISPECIES: hypothetical protein [unclassified Fibrobacter]|uniref:hypothetical protein n=1 Tax=unclassified Fibrobacter TaxID=2634177 RepID=UPI0025C1AD00|nr:MULTISPECIES: hypothetical protein [unclassified Fibrobacter]
MMRNFVKMLLLMAALSVSVFLVACGGEGGDSVSGGRHIEGNIYPESRWTALQGGFYLHVRLVPVAVEVTLLDERLDSIGKVDVKLVRHRNGATSFASDSLDLASSLLRIKFTCVYADSSSGLKMDFVQYVDIDKDSVTVLSLSEALQSKRIEFLVQEDGFDLEGARRKANREIRSLLDYDTQGDLSMTVYINQICIIEKPDTAFYANYMKLRDAMGEDKTWRDFFSETEIGDTLFNRNRWEDFWIKSFGLPSCDSSNFKDTASVTNKESAHYGKVFVCDNPEYENKYKWRLMTDFEMDIGVCTPALRDTASSGHVVYICDSAKTEWRKMPEKQGLLYLYGECKGEVEGDSVLYDSVYYVCASHEDWLSRVIWEWKVPLDDQWSDPVNIFVRKHEGLCNGGRSGEMALIEGKYYLCKDSVWKESDRNTYFLGECDSLGRGKKAHHDSVGYFICRPDEWPRSGSKWEEVLIPDYYGDECKPELAGYVKKYDGTLYICRARAGFSGSHWEVPSYTDIAEPVRNGNLCEMANEGEVVEYGGVGYKCGFPVWEKATDYELKVHRAIVRNKYKPDLCFNGTDRTSIFWDEADTALYGCVEKFTEANYGWGQVRYEMKYAAFADIHDPRDVAGGIYENGDYIITRNGWKYSFYISGLSSSGDKYGLLVLQSVVPETGVPFEITGGMTLNDLRGEMVIRAAIGDSAVALDAVDGKSASFDAYFTDWKQQVVESTGCPDATITGISCVSDWGTSTVDVVFNHYNENSYTTWEQAKDFCPEGSHIPSADEWLYQNYADWFSIAKDRALRVRQKKDSGDYGTFDVEYSFVWTSTEKDSETQYCFEYAKADNGWYGEKGIMSGIVECPKDLYPMVQAICVSDRREE